MDDELFRTLPKVVDYEGPQKYWVFQVWDMVRTHQTRLAADAAFDRFIRKNEKKEGEIMAGIELGAFICEGGKELMVFDKPSYVKAKLREHRQHE